MDAIKLSSLNRIALLCLIFMAWAGQTKAQTTDQTVFLSAPRSPLSPQSYCPVYYKYFGNSFSHKFHRPACIFALAISRSHLVLFQWRWQAIAAHFQPCRYCLPPTCLSVRGAILPTHPQNVLPDLNENEQKGKPDQKKSEAAAL